LLLPMDSLLMPRSRTKADFAQTHRFPEFLQVPRHPFGVVVGVVVVQRGGHGNSCGVEHNWRCKQLGGEEGGELLLGFGVLLRSSVDSIGLRLNFAVGSGGMRGLFSSKRCQQPVGAQFPAAQDA